MGCIVGHRLTTPQSNVHNQAKRCVSLTVQQAVAYREYGPTHYSLLQEELVAESCADGDLVATLGAAAIENGSSGLGLHAGEKPVGLGAVTTVRLEGTLRHCFGSC